jgi:hypothetical protein
VIFFQWFVFIGNRLAAVWGFKAVFLLFDCWFVAGLLLPSEGNQQANSRKAATNPQGWDNSNKIFTSQHSGWEIFLPYNCIFRCLPL